MPDKPDLKVDFCSHEAAKFACINWHYSKCLPVGKLVKVGAWEDGKYIGAVIFGRGASPYLGKKYNLRQDQCVELVRVALTKHKTEVSRIVSSSIRMIKEHLPGIKLIISFADPEQGHIGGIYQAGNWVYTGVSGATMMWHIDGEVMHKRSVGARYNTTIPEEVKKIAPSTKIVWAEGKYRYLMPLDKKMRRQIVKLSKPYPKKTCPEGVTGSTSGVQLEGIGSSPVPGLQNNPEKQEVEQDA